MLAIGRALMTNPKLLVLDEATEGLAPLIRAEIWDCLKRLKAEGQSILVIDKNLKALLGFVDRIAVIEKGRIVWRGSAGEFQRRTVDRGTLSSCRRRSRRRPLSKRKRTDMDMILTPGITKAGEGLDNIAWNILGQTYVPKQVSERSFAWHATFRPTRSCRRISIRRRTSSSTCSRASSS